ncbi:MAG: fatty acid desaturase [Phormidesmis sp. CAN_BIN36]|nr:fatty acid desaturase [Phormidesmis sp. CAN_BIN36]
MTQFSQTFAPSAHVSNATAKRGQGLLFRNRGLLAAFSIIGTWATSLVVLLSIDISQLTIGWRIAATVWQTFLYTGLFITAHDAMHGAIAPSNPKLNQWIGSFTLIVYALFDYKKMVRTHWLHHQQPASEIDPDFHNGKVKNFFAWYGYFMFRYWSWVRLFGLMIIYTLIGIVLNVPKVNLNWFWVAPSIASSLQLFFFGTYLPHREPEGGYLTETRAQSSNWSVFWSFITCYHFGYHEEHHEQPNVPWWGLPELHQRRLDAD